MRRLLPASEMDGLDGVCEFYSWVSGRLFREAVIQAWESVSRGSLWLQKTLTSFSLILQCLRPCWRRCSIATTPSTSSHFPNLWMPFTGSEGTQKNHHRSSRRGLRVFIRRRSQSVITDPPQRRLASSVMGLLHPGFGILG